MNKFLLILLFLILIVIFRTWLLPIYLSSGDWVYYFPESIQQIVPFSAWDSRAHGLGSSIISTLWLESYFTLTSKFSLISSWVLYERIFWFWPFLLFSLSSSYLFFKRLFSDIPFSFLASFIYTINTYIILLVSGGQMGIALSYSFFPFVFLSFINTFEHSNAKNVIISSLLLSILVMFDLRIAYVFIFSFVIYFIFQIIFYRNIIKIFFKIFPFLISGIIVLLIHSFWVLPIIISKENPINQFDAVYSSVGALKFFSFAFLENSFSLLHPNWPENLFGKTYFMRAEFLLLSILAYSSLLFLNSKLQIKSKKFNNNKTFEQFNNRTILFFALLGLIGAFLAKGTNEPFGQIYIWLFEHFPGFVMFRDPTKWYLFVAVSYSVLIPFSIYNIYKLLQSKQRFKVNNKNKIFKLQNIFLLFAICYLLFLVNPALLGQVKGTLSGQHELPKEYLKYKDFMISQNKFVRSLWIPRPHRFAYSSETNPAVRSTEIFMTSSLSAQLKKFQTPKTLELLQNASIGYVVVPFNTEGERFLYDSEYGKKQMTQIVKVLNNVPWLRRLDGFGRLVVFKLPNSKDHFWIEDKQGLVDYKYIAPTKYEVFVKNVKKGDVLVFSENFDPNWKLDNSEFRIQSIKFRNNLNSFTLPRDGNYELEIFYEPQRWVNKGLIISSLSLVLIIGALFIL